MLDRPRVAQLSWAAVLLVLFVLLGLAVDQGWTVLRDFDERGDGAQAWAVDEEWLHRPLRAVEIVFSTIGMTILTAVLAVMMFVRRPPARGVLHRRRDGGDLADHHPDQAARRPRPAAVADA